MLMAVAAEIRVFCSVNEPTQLPGCACLVPRRSGLSNEYERAA